MESVVSRSVNWHMGLRTSSRQKFSGPRSFLQRMRRAEMLASICTETGCSGEHLRLRIKLTPDSLKPDRFRVDKHTCSTACGHRKNEAFPN